MTSPLTLPVRLQEKIQISPDGCWLWTACVTTNGYGQVWWQGKPRRPHRVVFELLHGAIPAHLTVDHRCRQPLCVNPMHLDIVTVAENNRRRGDAVVECPKGHAYTPENTRVCKRGYRSCKTCENGRKR